MGAYNLFVFVRLSSREINCNQRAIATHLFEPAMRTPFGRPSSAHTNSRPMHTYASRSHSSGSDRVWHFMRACSLSELSWSISTFRCFLMAILVTMTLYCSSSIDPSVCVATNPLNLFRFSTTPETFRCYPENCVCVPCFFSERREIIVCCIVMQCSLVVNHCVV